MNNEYAFPLAFESYQSSDPPQKNNKGMTLLDFFASQAPKEIPPWFNPEPLHDSKPKQPTDAYTFAKEHDPTGKEGLYAKLSGWLQDPCFDFSTNGSIEKTFQDLIENYRMEKETWDNNNQVARYFIWRWYYAHKMLAEREHWIGDNNHETKNP